MWEVRWTSRHGKYHGDVREELECFVSQELADGFAESLRAAFRLIRHSSETKVTVEKASSK